jgi:signal transduction histidine kinase
MKGPALLRRNLAARLALVFGLISGLVVLVMGLGIYYLTSSYLNARATDDLAALADFYAAYTAAAAPDEVRLTALAPQITGFFAPQAGYDVRLFNARNGDLLAATRDIGPLPSYATLAKLSRPRITFFVMPSYDQPDRLYAAREILTSEGASLAVVEVSRDIAESRAFLHALRLVLVAAGGLALLGALAASFLLARQMTRPLQEMESATQAIASGDFDRRLTVLSEDEIGRLATSINQMAADLARLEAARREFIAKVSHDLRTPLTAIKGLVVNLLDRAPQEMQASLVTADQQTERLIRLVNDLLALSRLQRGELRLRCVDLDLSAVARSAAALVDQKAKRLGVTLVLAIPEEPVAVRGDADRLQQVTVNLLDNALRATPPGGSVQLQVTGSQARATLTVLDAGRGLTEEEANRAFEAYFRGPGGGAGLGLTIAQEIITAHEGHIWLRNLPAGGAEAGFHLPGGH